MELRIFEFIIENFHNPVMDFLMQVISFLGGAVIWVAVGIVLLFLKKYRVVGVFTIAATLITILLCEFGLKLLFMRERPFVVHDFDLIVSEPYGSSFPSSHTAQSFAGAVPLFAGKKWWGITALIFAALVGFSRMYLLVHFPSDVLAGAVFGSVIGVIAVVILRKMSVVK